jgi:hypothetical protein
MGFVSGTHKIYNYSGACALMSNPLGAGVTSFDDQFSPTKLNRIVSADHAMELCQFLFLCHERNVTCRTQWRNNCVDCQIWGSYGGEDDFRPDYGDSSFLRNAGIYIESTRRHNPEEQHRQLFESYFHLLLNNNTSNIRLYVGINYKRFDFLNSENMLKKLLYLIWSFKNTSPRMLVNDGTVPC